MLRTLQARELLRTVQPFDARMFKTHRSIAPGTRRGLEVLEECARLLLQELRLEGYALGLTVKVQVRGFAMGSWASSSRCAAQPGAQTSCERKYPCMMASLRTWLHHSKHRACV